MNQPIYHVRPANLFFAVFGVVFVCLCSYKWFNKKRITREDIGFNIVCALIIAGFLLFVTWFGLQ
jgi:hypothetical protein